MLWQAIAGKLEDRAEPCRLNIHDKPDNPRPGNSNAMTWVGEQTLAELGGISIDTVSRHMSLLEREGLISRHLRDRNVRKSRVTILHWDAIIAGGRTRRCAAGAPPETELSHPEVDVDDLENSRAPGFANGDTSPMASVTTDHRGQPCCEARTVLKSKDDFGFDMFVRLLRDAFPKHANFATERDVAYLRQNLQASIDIAVLW
jgi:DNA-binding transcriptional ArsR family regulator